MYCCVLLQEPDVSSLLGDSMSSRLSVSSSLSQDSLMMPPPFMGRSTGSLGDKADRTSSASEKQDPGKGCLVYVSRPG